MKKKDEMNIGFTLDENYFRYGRYSYDEGNIAYYSGREKYIGSLSYPAIKGPILGNGLRDRGYGTL